MNSVKVFLKDYGIRLLKIVMAVLVLYYLVFNLNYRTIYKTINNAETVLISLAFLLLPVNIFLQYLKWKLSCRYFFRLDNRKKIISSLFSGFSAAIFTPARLGEYLGRAAELKNYKLTIITAAVFFDKIYTLFWVLVLGLTALYLLYIQVVYIVVLIILVVILFGIIKYFHRIKRYADKFKPAQSFLELFNCVKLPGQAYSVKMFVYSFLFYGCYLIQFMLLLSAFTGSQNYLMYFTIAASVMFVKTMIPNFISGEIGIRESAAVFFMSQAGENIAAGFNASVLLFLINIAIPSALGLSQLVRNKQ